MKNNKMRDIILLHTPTAVYPIGEWHSTTKGRSGLIPFHHNIQSFVLKSVESPQTNFFWLILGISGAGFSSVNWSTIHPASSKDETQRMELIPSSALSIKVPYGLLKSGFAVFKSLILHMSKPSRCFSIYQMWKVSSISALLRYSSFL